MSRLIIDVRTPDEYANRHLEGAINISYYDTDFSTQISAFPKDQEYIVYCNAGGRAGRAKNRMKSLGFTDVTSYGIMAASLVTGAPVLYQS